MNLPFYSYAQSGANGWPRRIAERECSYRERTNGSQTVGEGWGEITDANLSHAPSGSGIYLCLYSARDSGMAQCDC